MRVMAGLLLGTVLASSQARAADVVRPSSGLDELHDLLGQFEFHGSSKDASGKPQPSQVLVSCGAEIEATWITCGFVETVTVGPRSTNIVRRIFVGWEPTTRSYRAFQVDSLGGMWHYAVRLQHDASGVAYLFESLPLPGAKGKAETQTLKFSQPKSGKMAFTIARGSGKTAVLLLETDGKRL
jgi:hypothetical protein